MLSQNPRTSLRRRFLRWSAFLTLLLLVPSHGGNAAPAAAAPAASPGLPEGWTEITGDDGDASSDRKLGKAIFQQIKREEWPPRRKPTQGSPKDPKISQRERMVDAHRRSVSKSFMSRFGAIKSSQAGALATEKTLYANIVSNEIDFASTGEDIKALEEDLKRQQNGLQRLEEQLSEAESNRQVVYGGIVNAYLGGSVLFCPGGSGQLPSQSKYRKPLRAEARSAVVRRAGDVHASIVATINSATNTVELSSTLRQTMFTLPLAEAEERSVILRDVEPEPRFRISFTPVTAQSRLEKSAQTESTTSDSTQAIPPECFLEGFVLAGPDRPKLNPCDEADNFGTQATPRLLERLCPFPQFRRYVEHQADQPTVVRELVELVRQQNEDQRKANPSMDAISKYERMVGDLRDKRDKLRTQVIPALEKRIDAMRQRRDGILTEIRDDCDDFDDTKDALEKYGNREDSLQRVRDVVVEEERASEPDDSEIVGSIAKMIREARESAASNVIEFVRNYICKVDQPGRCDESVTTTSGDPRLHAYRVVSVYEDSEVEDPKVHLTIAFVFKVRSELSNTQAARDFKPVAAVEGLFAAAAGDPKMDFYLSKEPEDMAIARKAAAEANAAELGGGGGWTLIRPRDLPSLIELCGTDAARKRYACKCAWTGVEAIPPEDKEVFGSQPYVTLKASKKANSYLTEDYSCGYALWRESNYKDICQGYRRAQ